MRKGARVLDRLSGWGYAPALLGTAGGLVLGMEFINGRVLGHDVAMGSDEVFRPLRPDAATLPAAGLATHHLHRSNLLFMGSMPLVGASPPAWLMPAWRTGGSRAG